MIWSMMYRLNFDVTDFNRRRVLKVTNVNVDMPET